MVMHASREPLFCQLPGGLSKLVHFKLKHPNEPFRSPRGGGVNSDPKFAWILVSDETLKGRFCFFFTLSTQCQSRDKQVLLPFLCVHWVSASFLLFLMICPLQSWGWVPVFVVEPCLQYEQGFISGPWPPSIYQGRNSAYELPLRLSFLSKVHLKHLLKV